MISNMTYENLLDTFDSFETYLPFVTKKFDDDLWLKTRTENTTQAYEHYLNTLPKGIHKQEALEVINKIKRQMEWSIFINWAKEKNIDIPSDIDEIKHLTSLDLSNKQLTALPSEITKLTQLTSLNLYHNKLTTLPPEVTKLTQLTSLNLALNAFNELSFFPPEITNLKQLKSLHLGLNNLHPTARNYQTHAAKIA